MAQLLLGVGILIWIMLAILVALFVARMIRLRDRDSQHPVRIERAPTPDVDDAESLPPFQSGRQGRKRLANLRRARR